MKINVPTKQHDAIPDVDKVIELTYKIGQNHKQPNYGSKKLNHNNQPAAEPTDLPLKSWIKLWSYVYRVGNCYVWKGSRFRDRPTFRYLNRRVGPARILLLAQGKIDPDDVVFHNDDCEKYCIRHVYTYTRQGFADRCRELQKWQESIYDVEE